jgi:uncharacterized protein (TIGR01777 family)
VSTSGRVIIAGGSGFLGTILIPPLLELHYEPVVLTRGDADIRDGVRLVRWDAQSPGNWQTELDGAAAIVNVVGRTVDCRKTPLNKRVILESRVNSVKALAQACKNVSAPPPVWVQAGTAHIFGDTGDEVLDESSPIGTGFAPEVGTAWEKAFADVSIPGLRKVILRISFVIGQGGGALKTLARLTRLFLGGATGTGKQYMSWLHAADFAAIVLRAITDPSMAGMYVATSPNPVTNDDFMKTLRKVLHRPWSPRVPEPLVRLGAVLLRTDPELALYGRRCVPTRLLRDGFAFRFPQLEPAMQDLLADRVAR